MNSKLEKVKRVTIVDLAKKSGYSLMTVSRALNNSLLVKESTKDKIKRIANEFGYIPDAVARSLKSEKSNLLGIIITNSANPFYAELLHSIERKAKEDSYNVVLVNTEEDIENEVSAVNLMLSLKAAGISIAPCQKGYEHFLKLNELKYPYITISRRAENIHASYVLSDNKFGSYIATKHLIELGHEQIVFIGGSGKTSTKKERLYGFYKALKEFNLNTDETTEIDSEVSYIEGSKCFDRLKNYGQKFTGIIAYNDVIAIGFICRAMENGLRIPNDLSIVGYDDIDISKFIYPKLTTVSQKIKELGYIHYMSLIKLIKGEVAQIKRTIKPELIIRQTTAKPR